jgi:capsular exopolysaccharide synthesis family protein
MQPATDSPAQARTTEEIRTQPLSEVAPQGFVPVDADRRSAAAVAPARELPGRLVREVRAELDRVDPHLVTLTQLDERADEEYGALAVSLMLGAADRDIKRVLVTSAERGDGRTTVAVNLACALARARNKALVVDCDLRRPSVGRMLGLEGGGYVETLERENPGDGALVRVLPYGFDVLPAREHVDESTGVLALPAFHRLLDALDETYDFIIFDAPPLGTAADIRLLSRLADTTLLVVRSGATSAARMSRAINPLTEEMVFGVVINRAAN